MPFYIADANGPGDAPERIADERQRAADRIISRLPRIGAGVTITKEMPPELALHDTKGIVVGVMPVVGSAYQVQIMCSMARGTEMAVFMVEGDFEVDA